MKEKKEIQKIQVAHANHTRESESTITPLPTEDELFRLFWAWARAEARRRGVYEFEDIAIIAFTETFHAYDPVKAFRALLNRILGHRINDALRRQGRRVSQPLDFDIADESEERRRHLAELKEEVQTALLKLSAEERWLLKELND